MDRPYGMLFISRRNSARSLMTEAVVNRLGGGRLGGGLACGLNTGAISQGLKPPS